MQAVTKRPRNTNKSRPNTTMSTSQDEIRQIPDFSTPTRSIFSKKKGKRRNKVQSPPDQSPLSKSGKKSDVFELFTVKTAAKPRVVASDSQDSSELSDDVFVKPKPSASTPSTKSYREKINERFNNLKEKAGKSTKKANVFKEATEKILLEKVKRESSDIDAELELMRNRLKLGKISGKNEVYDFFCAEKCPESAPQESEDNFKSTDDLTKDAPDLKFILPQQLTSIIKSSEKATFFKPKAIPVDIIDKLDGDEPRYLEEEGFYVPPKPKIPPQHLNLVEQRLSHDDKKWFDCEGRLAVVENPCQKSSHRPHLKHLSIDEITTYLQPKVENHECEEIVIIRDNLLLLQISSLKFTHHPLFSLEHVLEQRLTQLYEEYEESVSKNNLIRLTRRLEGLRNVLKRFEEDSGDHSDNEDEKANAYKRDIKILQNELFEEGKIERNRTKAILATWKAIKKIREVNKFSNTSIKLVIRKENVDYESEKENFDKNFEEVYEELLSEYQQKTKRKKYNEDDIKEDLLERFKESFRAPGEPILYFSLNKSNENTKNVENLKETARRNVVASTKVTLKVVCNEMEVCKTKSLNLRDDFACNFDETISMQLVTVPKFITVEVIEQPRSLIKRTVVELTLPIPPRSSSKNEKRTAKFEKNERVHYKHEGVGSGIEMGALVQDLGLEIIDQELNTAGYLVYSLKWNNPIISEDKTTDEDGQKIIDEIIDKNGSINLDKLSQWIHQHKPDPQDPKNSILYEYFLACGEEDMSSITNRKNYFRLNPHLDSWKFCDPKILEDNIRLKVLQLRNRNEPEFDRMIIPNRIKEIPLDILADYKRRIASERETFSIEDDDDEDDEIEKKRSRGKKYLKQIHIRVFQKCKNSQNNLTFEDVVDEKLLDHFQKMIKEMVIGFIAWFRWRPLKSSSAETKKTASQDSKLDDYEIKSRARVVVTVISALNIPERSENQGDVTSFVEGDYNNVTARTSTSQGPHPSWNEKLILPLESSHLDYLNPNSLNGTITLNIFDENDKDLLKFPGKRSQNWLGGLEIPLSAICFSGIQGMFKVKTPHLLLGYKEKDQSAKINHTYINLQVVMEPNIPKLSPNIEELPCADLPYIQEHALRWNEEYNLNFPNRKFSVFAIDTNANTACIVRYIKPLEPPQINVEGFDVTPEQCARFISLIPFTDCNQLYKNIWLSVDRFLHFMIGSIIDHAVALTCYLLALKLEAWLLLGFGVPYGTTAFVLVKERDSNRIPVYYIYDVIHGEKINLTDPFCPLQKIYCVINEHNLWANIQRNDDVTIMSFDFSRKSDWLPLFDNQISAPTNSVHGKLTYLSPATTDELEIILDRKIRKKIAKMRQLDRTIWNHQVSNAFKGVLSSFEKTQMYGKSSSDTLERIRECVATYKIRGHVFNSPFTDVTSIVKKVKSYGLHLEEDADTQFASAVYLKSYPNQVLAVWVFVAAIKENSQIDLETQ